MVTSTILKVSQLDVVVLVFGKRDPIRLFLLVDLEIVSVGGILVGLKDEVPCRWVYSGVTEIELTVVIARHVKPVVSVSGRLKIASVYTGISSILNVEASLKVHYRGFVKGQLPLIK